MSCLNQKRIVFTYSNLQRQIARAAFSFASARKVTINTGIM